MVLLIYASFVADQYDISQTWVGFADICNELLVEPGDDSPAHRDHVVLIRALIRIQFIKTDIYIKTVDS